MNLTNTVPNYIETAVFYEILEEYKERQRYNSNVLVQFWQICLRLANDFDFPV